MYARVDHRLHQQEDLRGEAGQTRGIGRRGGRQWGAPPRSLALELADVALVEVVADLLTRLAAELLGLVSTEGLFGAAQLELFLRELRLARGLLWASLMFFVLQGAWGGWLMRRRNEPA